MIAATGYATAYADLLNVGLNVVGVDFYRTEDESKGYVPPNWRGYIPAAGTNWLCIEQADRWAHVAYAAIQKTLGPLWDVASRISNQLRVCEWRLRQLSEAYYDHLTATVMRGKFSPRSGLLDGFTWLGYLALQSFLVDSGVLRDHLAEYRALLFPASVKTKEKIVDMASLKKHYLDKFQLDAEVDKSLMKATSDGEWLFRLSKYRNLVVHYAPMASADKTLYAYCFLRHLRNGVELPSIKLPIPEDPGMIISSRKSGAHLDDPKLNYARFVNALKDPDKASDGLEYAQQTLWELASLARQLMSLSPVAPQMPHFEIGRDGKVTQV